MTRKRLGFEKRAGKPGPGPRVKWGYTKPTVDQFVAIVMKMQKNVGLALLYHRFGIPKKFYPRYRQMWDMIEQKLIEKGVKNAASTQIQSAEAPEAASEPEEVAQRS